jgi:hypothetical protein
MCLILLIMMISPRAGILIWYLVDPNRWERSFDTWVWPLLGAIFLPWTTIMWVAVAPFGTAAGWDWLWLTLAFFIDLMSLLGGGYGNRNRVPGYTNY